MFKVIRELVAQPQFLIMCDRACGVYATAAISAGPQVSEDAQQSVWARTLLEAGWKITLAEHLCPQHNAGTAEKPSGLIIVPTVAGAGGYRN